MLAACDAAGIALVPLAAPDRGRLAAHRRQGARVPLHGVRHRHHGRAQRRGRQGLIARAKASKRRPVALGFGISTPEQARAAEAGADGVIVGSRLVRAAAEAADAGEDPAAAAGA